MATKEVVFTERQVEVVEGLARGLSREEIGAELGIHPTTVKAHIDVVRRKLAVQHARQIPAAYADLTGEDPYP